MREDIRVEDQLCVLLSRSHLGPVQQRILNLLAAPVQWGLLLQKAYLYEVAPLIYHNLEALDFPGVPCEVRTELSKFLAVNAIRNELLAKELARLLQLLGDAKIPVIPLKSTVLAEALYEDPALRVCADIDLLVSPQNIVKAHNLLLAMGYISQRAQPFFLKLLERYGKDCELMREDELCIYPLELHCGLLWGGRLEQNLLKDVWADAVATRFYGVSAFALSSDWEFLYLAVHAARHGLHSLKWFVDLDRLCSQRTLDWTSIKQKAVRLGWEGPVRESLLACSELFGTVVDPAFAARGSGSTLSRLDPASPEVPGGIFFSMRLLKTPAQKIRFLLIRSLVPTSADGRFLALPSSLAFLYYVVRPFRFVAKAVWWALEAGTKKLRRLLSAS